MRVRRAGRFVVATWVVALLLPALVSSPAVASSAHQGATAVTTAGLVVHEVDDPDSDAAIDYWTPGRMRSARPPTQIGTAGAFGAEQLAATALLPGSSAGSDASPVEPAKHADGVATQEPEHTTGFLGPREIAGHPHTSIGKVFFNLRGFDFSCSASAVTSAGRWGAGTRSLVVTAGHCLSNGNGAFATSWVFVPGYSDGHAPFGVWPARRVFTTAQWHVGGDLARDVGFAQLAQGTAEHAGSELHDVIEPLGIAFTEKYEEDGLKRAVEAATGTRYASFGYGVLHWGGEKQVRTVSRVVKFDPFFSPPPMGMPSTHTGGASGGPWLQRYEPGKHGTNHNLVNSVNSYMYFGVDEVYGPQFDDAIHRLWAVASATGAFVFEPESVADLIAQVEAMQLPARVDKALLRELDQSVKELERYRFDKACRELDEFSETVARQADQDRLTPHQADDLQAAAAALQDRAACS